LKIRLLILLFSSLSISLWGTTYYVSPTGIDSNPGTITQPFFTLNKAWSKVVAGDIIYMRGGTYRYNNTGSSLTGKSGTSVNLISILAYHGEKPVINYNNETFSSQLVGITISDVSYLYMKGIRVTGINQPSSSTFQYGLILWNNVTNSTFEQMETDHIGGWGTVVGNNCNNILFLNCDSHHNADPLSVDSYGGSDGFQSGSWGSGYTSTNITYRGCRAWNNSDDGWDLRKADGIYTLENCWSFHNGVRENGTTKGGDGEGFKLGGSSSYTTSILRTVKNCLAFYERSGFSPEPDVQPTNNFGLALYNCVAYANSGVGIDLEYSNVAIAKNNIVYNNAQNIYSWGANVTHNHNNLDIPITVTNSDFLSTDSTGVTGARQADGSLPSLSFLHLAAGSKLIDAGVDVGLPYTGKAPDLGAFEFQSGSTKPNSPPIVIISYETDSYSGFVYELDASASYDPDNEALTYAWVVPNNVTVSSTTSSKIQFLTPVVNASQKIDFQLKVTDGTAIVTKIITINILPYKPELETVKIKTVQGSSYQSPDYPNNVSDGSLATKWSAIGDNQWLIFAFTEPFKISHLEIAFLPGQKYSSYFDIYASKDSITWEPILKQGTSCNFSGDLQTFDFPALNTGTEYSYLKYVGHGNSLDTKNIISEFRIFGTPSQNPGSGDTPKINIIIYPNPASNLVNISIDANSVNPDKIEIIDHSGNVVFEELIYSDTRNIQIPLSVKSGNYIVELFKGNSVLLAKKLIVMN
jgi:hypothetical protein